MHAEQAGEQPGLGLAQLREAGGDGLDRAVTLAELDGPAAWQGPNGGRVAVRRQAVGEGQHAPDDVVPGRRDGVTMATGQVGDALVGELPDDLLAAEASEEADGLGCQVGVGVGQGGLTSRRGNEPPRRPAASRPPDHRGGVLDDLAGLDQGPDVATHARGRELEVSGELDDRDRALLDDQPQDAMPGRAVRVRRHRGGGDERRR